MEKTNVKTGSQKVLSALTTNLHVVGSLFLILFLSACKETEDAAPAPTITLGSGTGANTVGGVVTTTINLSAPAGLRTLNILKNGVTDPAFPAVSFNGETSATHDFSYSVESLPANSRVNFTFQAVDARNQQSALVPFSVTVSATPPKQVVEVTGNITQNTTWTKDKIYLLKGFVRVGRDEVPAGGTEPAIGATAILTIQPGTMIMGDRETKGTLVVQRGSQLIANGTREEPIVFTSEREPGLREPGDWGGVVLCGRAVNNQGLHVQMEGGYGAWHGGTDDADNSGILRFVRIEYAGIPINPNEEVNSLTMGSVGSGTVIEHVQCSFGLDDAFEWFGGTVNGKYLVAYRGLDDDLDVDFGYRGNVQHALVIRGASLADQSGSNGFEVDNDGQGSDRTPFTAGVFSNVTVIGPKKEAATAIQPQFQNAMHLRRNNRVKIYNSFFTGFPNGLFVDGTNTQANAAAGELQLRNIILAGVEGWGSSGFGQFAVRDRNTANPQADIFIGGQKPSDWFVTPAFNNAVLPRWQDAGINGNVFDLGRPTLTNPAGLQNKAKWDNTPAAGNFFDKTVTYIGAFGTTDWTEGWTEWNPASKTYR